MARWPTYRTFKGYPREAGGGWGWFAVDRPPDGTREAPDTCLSGASRVPAYLTPRAPISASNRAMVSRTTAHAWSCAASAAARVLVRSH
jgi:hypothetical protein